MVSEWKSDWRRDESGLQRNGFGQLHRCSHDQRLQQLTFNGDDRNGKSDSGNTDNHTRRPDDLLGRWQRDADLEQRQRKSVAAEWQPDWRRD